MIDGFRTLRDNVNDFAHDWQRVIDKHKKEKLTYVEQLDQHIAKLMGTLAECVIPILVTFFVPLTYCSIRLQAKVSPTLAITLP